MVPIAKRGETIALATMPFDPKTDNVVLRSPNLPDQTVMWQQALKFGWWVPIEDAEQP